MATKNKNTVTKKAKIKNNKRSQIIMVAFISLFALLGGYYFLVQSKAAQSDMAVIPFQNIPERGLSWKGLENAKARGACNAKAFEVHGLSGEFAGCTHGPDPAPAGIDVTEPYDVTAVTAQDTTTASGYTCIDDGASGSRVQMIYAVSSDRTDRYTSLIPNFSTWAGQIQDEVSKSAAKTGGQRYVRFATNSDCSVNVAHVTLSPTGDDTFGDTITELRAQGYNLSSRDYVIWSDAIIYCGIGQVGGTSTDTSATNTSNIGPHYARVDTGCWNRTDHSSALHEFMHNIGAVQLDAPHSTGGWHCTDDYDVMCYADSAGVTMTTNCPNVSDEYILDCGNDDYFSTNPAAGSYLATHWNTANSVFFANSLNNTVTTVDTTAPSIPSGVTANSVDSSRINVQWVASTDTGGSGMAGYKIWRNGTQVASVNGAVLSYTDTGLIANTTYNYTVSAFDNAGNQSNKSLVVYGKTGTSADTAGPQITIASPNNGQTVRNTLSINATATDLSSVAYMSITIDGTLRASSNTSAVSYSVNTKKWARGVHTIIVSAKDSAGNVSTATISVNK